MFCIRSLFQIVHLLRFRYCTYACYLPLLRRKHFFESSGVAGTLGSENICGIIQFREYFRIFMNNLLLPVRIDFFLHLMSFIINPIAYIYIYISFFCRLYGDFTVTKFGMYNTLFEKLGKRLILNVILFYGMER